jgi:peptide chain release factor 1
MKWKAEIIDDSQTDLDGYRYVACSFTGKGVSNYLKYESGVHRVQRVPKTEAQGRLHTSTCSVVVLLEPNEIDLEIKQEDLKIQFYRSSGPGGQNVNKLSTAVRLTHVPTGEIVSCQTERSQHRNRDMAMRMLRTRLYDKMQFEQKESMDKVRKTAIGRQERSEKIRTYNFPQNRLTSHTHEITIYELDKIMLGNLDLLIDKLRESDRQLLLSQAVEKIVASVQ